MCRRVLILHSYRDGRGKVCQRRLGHFTNLAGLERELQDLPRRCPELECDVPRLRQRAKTLLSQCEEPKGSSERARKAVRALLDWLSEEPDPQVLAPELAALRGRLEEVVQVDATPLSRTRSVLPTRRRRFDPSDGKAQPYLRSLDRLAEEARQQGREHEEARILEERVKACPDSQARLQYGALLQKLGRHDEAIEQYQRLPDGEGHRHYNLASACWQLGDFERALVHLLRGMARQPETAEALVRVHQGKPARAGSCYWQEFGELWDALAKKFLVAIAGQHLVRRRVRQAREWGVKVRNLVPPSSRVWLLQRGLAAVQVN